MNAENAPKIEHTILEDLLKRSKEFGWNTSCMSSPDVEGLSHRKLWTGVQALASAFRSKLTPDMHVGIFLPNVVPTAVSIFAIQYLERVPTMLNYSHGEDILVKCCETVGVQTVITSYQFIEKGKLEKHEAALKENGIHLIYLEDIKKAIKPWVKIGCLVKSFFPSIILKKYQANPEDEAIVLFTSGSEGLPKGVALSHENILSNIEQLRSAVPLTPEDSIFACLPLFHSFGYTVCLMYGLLNNCHVHLYPSPIDYPNIPKALRKSKCTILGSSNTFLQGYGKYAKPEDMEHLRIAYAGAEPLKAPVNEKYAKEFGVTILQGYGVTETSPVLAVNRLEKNDPDSVGHFLNWVEWRLEAVEGIHEGGRLFAKAKNVMMGYYRHSDPGQLEFLIDGWYDTGDIVSVDEDGRVKIVGRAKRFAKIGGEKVSLAASETFLSGLYPDDLHAVIAADDTKKGQRLVLYTTNAQINKNDLTHHAAELGHSNLLIPNEIIHETNIPVFRTGKLDYVTIEKNYQDTIASQD